MTYTITRGWRGAEKIQKLYGEAYAVSRHCPFLDDWNDVLKNYRRNLEGKLPTRQNSERLRAVLKPGRLDRAI